MIPTLIHDLSIHVIGKHVLMFHKPKRRPCFLQCGTWGQYKGEAVGEHLCQLSVSSAWPSPWRARPCNSHLNIHRLSKKTILIQSSLDMALNPREATEHARTTQGSSFKVPDKSQCQHPPHPDHHPDRLASHRGPVLSLHQVGALLESWLTCLLFSPLGFHFYSTILQQSLIETRTAWSCVLKLNEKMEE